MVAALAAADMITARCRVLATSQALGGRKTRQERANSSTKSKDGRRAGALRASRADAPRLTVPYRTKATSPECRAKSERALKRRACARSAQRQRVRDTVSPRAVAGDRVRTTDSAASP